MSSQDDRKLKEFIHKKIEKLKKIKDKTIFFQIFQIIQDNNEKYSSNSNGIFFDVNLLSQPSLLKIKTLFNDLNDNNDSESITFTPYSEDVVEKKIEGFNQTKKLNNKERNIIKKLNSEL